MVKNRVEEGYTIEELERETLFSRSLIYDLTSFGCISRPVRGLEPTLYGSKGLYPLKALDQLNRYKDLKRSGLKKDYIIRVMQLELKQLSLEAAECSAIVKERERRHGGL